MFSNVLCSTAGRCFYFTKSQTNEMCDIFIMCFVLSEILSLEAVAAATASAVVVVVEEGRRRRSLWV